jgi:hypothetical protein
VSPVKYELGFYVPEDGILHSHCRENPAVSSVSPGQFQRVSIAGDGQILPTALQFITRQLSHRVAAEEEGRVQGPLRGDHRMKWPTGGTRLSARLS